MTASSDDLRRVVLLDTSVASTNLGDEIIMQDVRAELEQPFAGAFVIPIATHVALDRIGRALARSADVVVAGGTNLISSHMWLRPLWPLKLADAFAGLRVILMGVGWYQFQGTPDPYTRWLLRRVLHPSALHSVRDGYTARMLGSIGITNVVNTGCPTLWRLSPELCAGLPRQKAASVVTTLNTYMPDPDADRRLIELLRSRYARIYAWVQTAEDHVYLRSFGDDIVIIEPSLKAYDDLLASTQSLDYIGNRLHGGIRALRRGRRAIIVEIDNRAQEMGRDFHLPTVARTDFERLAAMIDSSLEIAVRPPLGAIARWKRDLKMRLDERDEG
ncbi:MAG: polysaccharide pyruvyl transferase family protein [Betaproteobacteria bacterium]